MADAEITQLKQQVAILQKTFDRFLEDYKEDTRMRGDIEVRIKHIEAKVDGVRDDLSDQTREVTRVVTDKTEEVTKPIVKKVNRLFSNKSEVLHYIEGKKPGGIINKLKFWRK